MISANKRIFYGLYLTAAIVAFWYWHVDEHYQIVEFASYHLGMTPKENLAWEYSSQIRSGILPLIAYMVSVFYLFLNFFNPFVVEATCRIIGTLAFIHVYIRLLDYFEFEKNSTPYKLSLFFWILPVVMVRFSSEAISSTLFWLGFLLYDYRLEFVKRRKLILVGLIWGLAFYVRIHVCILIGILFLWTLIYKRTRLWDIAWIFAGFLLSTGIELLSNYWLYGTWVWSPYGYFVENIIHDKASSFGEHPFYFYIAEISKNLIYPLGIAILTGFAYYILKCPKDLFTWLCVSFIFVHSLISHKEYRFLFPVFPILIPISILGLSNWIQGFRWKKIVFKILWVMNLILIPSCFVIQSFNAYNYLRIYPYTKLTKIIYCDTPNPYSLNNQFPQVRPYFWKDKACQIVEIDSSISINHSGVVYFVSSIDKGDTLKLKDKKVYKKFQTIPAFILDKLPESVQKSIVHVYLYIG